MRTLSARILPKGWPDLLRQIVLFCGAYWLYRLVRGFTDGRAGEAFENAREVIRLEQHLGLFIEPAIHTWTEGQRWLIDSTSWMYVNSHFVVTTFTLAFIYLRRNQSFYFIRNMFMVAMGIALVLYAAYPTAPPRFMPEWGFQDSVAEFTGLTVLGSSADALYNPFAAVPSMHVAFALMLGVPMAAMARRTAREGALVRVSAARHVRRRGHRQPLVVRRRGGRRGGRRLGRRGGRFRPHATRRVVVGPGHLAGTGLAFLRASCLPRRSNARAPPRHASTRRWCATASSSRG